MVWMNVQPVTHDEQKQRDAENPSALPWLPEQQRRNDGEREHSDRGEGEGKGRNASERNECQYSQADKGEEKNLSQDRPVD